MTPLKENWRALIVLERLERGPATTLDLQNANPLIHVARQVWELRHWYGFEIRSARRKRDRVAIYTLIDKPKPIVLVQTRAFDEPILVPHG